MTTLRILLSLGLGLGLIVSASAGDVNVKIQSLQTGWAKGNRANPADILDVMISLKSQNLERLDAEILAVSDPDSPRYGQHLTKEEVTRLTAPSQQAVQVVSTWLSNFGLAPKLSLRGDRFEFSASVGLLEKLFSMEVHEYWHEERSVPQAGDLHAPAEVARAIQAVVGLQGTPYKRSRPEQQQPQQQQQEESSAPESAESTVKGIYDVTPVLLKKVYNIEGVEVNRSLHNRRATAEFQGQYTAQSDLTKFFKEFVDPKVFKVQQGDELYTCGPAGHCEPPAHRAGTEAMLDIEYIAGVAPGIKNEVWSYQAIAWCTDLKKWTSDILDADSPPQVFSVSYGIQGNVSIDKNEGCSEEIARDIETDFAKIAARGVSVLISSGDSGSGGLIWPFKGQLWPSWPASAPHVTAVGATMFQNNNPKAGERATTQFGSGGGFDCRFPVQSWQKDVTQAYLANPKAGLPIAKDFCRDGRATPDVSALGEGYQVIDDGQTSSVGGTSASCPLFASLISLLNEYRLQNGKSPLGFLNPLLYKMGAGKTGFQDVTVGGNRIGRGSFIRLSEGYSCTEGWDAATGFGTPNFGQMLEFVKGLPSGQRQRVLELVV